MYNRKAFKSVSQLSDLRSIKNRGLPVMTNPIKISATIITFNEERKVEACIQSLLGVADEIIVVDSYSTDNTELICRQYPVKFIKHAFEGYVAQKNYAMRRASYDYILSLDADERLSGELRKSILEVKHHWKDVHGFELKRLNNYCGRWMRYSGWYERKIRLWDRRKAQWGGTDPHDCLHIPGKYLGKLSGDLIHYGYLTVDEHLKQNFRFAEIAARSKYEKGHKPNFVVNVIFSPLFRFVKSYFIQLGFLDGYYGFVFCAVSAQLTFQKYIRLYEYTRKGLPENEKKADRKVQKEPETQSVH